MLEFFRKYQKFFFLFTTVIIVFSFSFFGTFGSFVDEGNQFPDKTVSRAIDGTDVKLKDISLLTRFISADGEESSTFGPNFLNDGVLRNDFLRTGLADLIFAAYFDELQEGLESRLERAKRYRPYTHPQMPFISASSVWQRFLPDMKEQLDELQKKEQVDPETFSRFVKLYQQQAYLPPEFLRRILLYQQNQFSDMPVDPNLQYGDFSLFGFHTASDWFGKDFLDVIAQFIHNAAIVAEQKGFAVSMEEAKAGLHQNFGDSLRKMKEKKGPEVTYANQLHALGMDEKTATEVWQRVLLFRRYFHGMGEATFRDTSAYREFAGFANEKAEIQQYELPTALHLASIEDLLEFELYLKSVASQKGLLELPSAFASVDEVAKSAPELVSATYSCTVSEASKNQAGLGISVRKLWDWQLEGDNWNTLRETFSYLPELENRNEKFQALETLSAHQRKQIDEHSRNLYLDSSPSWVQNALSLSAPKEITLVVSNAQAPLDRIKNPARFAEMIEAAASGDEITQDLLTAYSDDNIHFYRIDDVEKIVDREVLTFEKARSEGILSKLVEKTLENEYPKIRKKHPSKFRVGESGWKPLADARRDLIRLYLSDLFKEIDRQEKNEWKAGEGPLDYYAAHRFYAVMSRALESIQKDPQSSEWLSQNEPSFADQFKLIRTEKEILRKEQPMQSDLFALVPKTWSPIEVPEDGNIHFFYLEERQRTNEPILDQIVFGKEMLSSDTQRVLTEKLLDQLKDKQAVVIPLQPNDDV